MKQTNVGSECDLLELRDSANHVISRFTLRDLQSAYAYVETGNYAESARKSNVDYDTFYTRVQATFGRERVGMN